MDNMDILYYDLLIENAQEERKINELIMIPSFAKYVCESSDEIAIMESNVLKNIGEAIKRLFQRVIEFFTKILNKIMNKEICKPKTELVEKVKERMKSFTDADRRQFSVKNADISGHVKKCVDLHTLLYQKSFPVLNEYIQKFNKYVQDFNKTDASYFGNALESIANINEQLDKVADPEDIKKRGVDVSFGDISEILKNYEMGTAITTTLRDELKASTKDMKLYQTQMTTWLINSTSNSKLSTSEVGNYRNIINGMTNFVIKLQKFKLNLAILLFNNQEAILRKFVMFNGETEYANPNQKQIGTSK